MYAKIISNQNEFNNSIAQLKSQTHISIDTEFDRRTTYFANLSLIQISSNLGIYIIDTLKVVDLKKLKEILLDNGIVKIFHSPEQDFEIFYNLFNIVPQNFFDTQIASDLCGFRKHISYGDLCKEICNVNLNKKLQNTNWLKRPISDSMLEYLILDVKYLQELYEYLNKRLDLLGKYNEYKNLLTIKFKEDSYKPNIEKAWTKVKIPRNLVRSKTEILKVIAGLRLTLAIEYNVPKKYIITDQDILKIICYIPRTIKELKKLNLNSRFIYQEKIANQIIDLLNGYVALNPHSS